MDDSPSSSLTAEYCAGIFLGYISFYEFFLLLCLILSLLSYLLIQNTICQIQNKAFHKVLKAYKCSRVTIITEIQLFISSNRNRLLFDLQPEIDL